ncbi:MAG: mechanosensitive ion channel domain-containing protein [Roseibium sp.]
MNKNCQYAFSIMIALFLGFGIAHAQTETSTDSEPVSIQQANEALIRLLEDPDSRAALIKQLEQPSNEPSAEGGEVTSPAPAADEVTDAASTESASSDRFILRIGEYTRGFADDVGVLIDRSAHSLNGLVLIFRGDIPVKWDRVQGVLVQVLVVLAAAYAAYWIGQIVALKTYKKLALKARYGSGLARTSILVLTTIIDGLTVALGLGVGYFVALLAYGGLETGVTIQESLALNAFFFSGMATVALRLVFAPNRPELRLLPFGDASSVYWTKRLRFAVYWVIYGVFLAVPLANIAVSFVLGNALRFLIVLSAMIYMMVLIQRNRLNVRDGARAYAEKLQSSLAQRAIINLGNLWHIAASGYILAMFVVWVTRPFDATTIILRATGLSIATIMAGMALSLIMTRAIKGGIRLPDELNEKLPALQYRLNAFVPRLLRIIRFAVFVVTVLLLLEIWGVISFLDWLASETGVRLVSNYGAAVVVIIAGFAVWVALMSWVDLRLQTRNSHIVTARERTLFQLFRNASTVVIVVMTVLLALSEIGINIGPLIAGAGVVGLAISFGAQTLVKDIITGAFIQIENAINEGDVVTVAGITGTVEGITVRSVRIRDLNGTTHIIPFSSVDMVSNFMRGYSYHVALIGVAYDTDIGFAKEAMHEAFRRLRETEYGPKIYADLEMNGVTNFGASSIDIRARIKTAPGDQWSVGRAYNEYVKQVFDERNIEIPFPQVTYHAATPSYIEEGDERKGSTVSPSKPPKKGQDAPPDVADQ